MLVAPTVCNNCIIWCWGNGGNNSCHRCNYYGSSYKWWAGWHWADVSIFYCKHLTQWTICNRPGCWWYWHAWYWDNWEWWCLTICNLVI